MLLIKVPALSFSAAKGCEKAPEEIIKALDEIYSNEQGKKIENFSIKELKVERLNIKATNENIFDEAKKLFEENKHERLIFLGGDHSITYPLVKAFSSCFSNAGLVVFDAHADCMPSAKEPTHEEWLRALIEKGFSAKNVFLVGSRNNDPEENKFLREKKLNIFSVNEFVENLEGTSQALMEKLRAFNAFYLSIDIDVVDPAFVPGTSYREPGGFSSRQLIYIIQKLNLLKNLKAVDIVEVNPGKDLNSMTVKLATKLIAELFNF